MARKKVREYNAKKILKDHIKIIAGLDLPINVAQVKENTNFTDLLDANPWLNQTKLVVKPDCLFGKRGKHDLVCLNVDFTEAESFINARMNKIINMEGTIGKINCFIIEPFVPHDAEFYLCIQTERLGTILRFSEHGGMDIEDNWDHVRSITIPTGELPTSDRLAPLISTLPIELRDNMEKFIQGVYDVYIDLDFTLIEMNPFTLDRIGKPFPLDMRGELDDTASFRSLKKWGDIEFPLPFGRIMTAQESYVHELDEGTGASLKLSILNPKGRVWTMVAGGGASVIYADTVGDLGYAQELGDYAEYSGGCNTQETYLFARTLLDCATANPDGRGRALIVGGGIANFTDVLSTFKGIIQAIAERVDAIRAAKMRIYVRRGGPNYKAGLAQMEKLGKDLNLPIEVFGPNHSMTGICQLAIDYVKACDEGEAAESANGHAFV